MKHFLLAVLFVVILPAALLVAKEEKMTIAIMDFVSKDMGKEEASKVSEIIRTQMVSSGLFIVIERAQMDKILKEQSFQQTGCTDVSCAVEMGKLLSARKMLVGSLMRMGGTVVITGRLVDVEKGVAEFAEVTRSEKGEEMFSTVDRFVERLSFLISGKRAIKYETGTKKTLENPYGWAAFPFALASLGSMGAAIYYDFQMKDTKKQYDRQVPLYYISGPASLIIHMKMNDLKSKSDNQEKMRLSFSIVSGGLGAFALPLGIAWIVKLAKKGKKAAFDTGIGNDLALVSPVFTAVPCRGVPRSFPVGLGVSMKF
jgi:TolB-like protein